MKKLIYFLHLLFVLVIVCGFEARGVEVDNALNKASQSLLVGKTKYVNETEILANSVSVIEPKSKLAYWLKAQSLFILAGVGFEVEENDKQFIEEAKARALQVPSERIPGNILGLTKNKNFIMINSFRKYK